jgi:hypothetical protein
MCGVYHPDLDQRQERRRLWGSGMLLNFDFSPQRRKVRRDNLSWSDFLKGEIRPNYLPEAFNQKITCM